MTFKQSQFTKSIQLVILLIFITGCSSSNFPVSDNGVVQAQQDRMNKDALRLKGKIIQKSRIVGDRQSYVVEIIELVSSGDTFGRVEPRIGELVTLYTPKSVKFRKNKEVLFDALSPISRKDDTLVLNLLVE